MAGLRRHDDAGAAAGLWQMNTTSLKGKQGIKVIWAAYLIAWTLLRSYVHFRLTFEKKSYFH
jgi:hypothetical protein